MMESMFRKVKARGFRPATADYPTIASQTEIRLLELEPPNLFRPKRLYGRLITAKVADSPEFEAVSYCWGRPVFPEILHLPTARLPITSNLAAGLRRLRHPNKVRRLWVDAICINQADSVEKGNQVQLMSAIYQGAAGVLVWLGEGNANTHAAVSILREIATHGKRSGLIVGTWSEWDVDNMPTLILADTAMVEILGQFSRTLSTAFFSDQAWFNRLWVVQEAVLATGLTYCNGQDVLDDWEFRGATYLLQSFNPTRNMTPEQTKAHKLVIQRQSYWYNKQNSTPLLSLRALLDGNSGRQCGNELDLVYGLLGLRDSTDIQVEVDYNVRVGDLYATVTSKYLERGDLSVLNGAGKVCRAWDGEHARRLESMPSWARDWKITFPTRIIEAAYFDAGTDAPPTFIQDKKQPSIIGLGGTELGSVKILVPLIKNLERSDVSQYCADLQTLIDQNTPGLEYHTGDTIDAALARTIVADGNIQEIARFGKTTGPDDLLRQWTWFKECFAAEIRTEQNMNYHDGRAGYFGAVIRMLRIRRFAITESGYFSMVPTCTEPGDLIVVFHNADYPSVIRRVEPNSPSSEPKGTPALQGMTDDNPFELIGSCYLHGFMNNEALGPEFDNKRRTFFLV